MRRIRGIGDRKLEDLGARFAAVIDSYCRPHALSTTRR
jgi:hypothetical protein